MSTTSSGEGGGTMMVTNAKDSKTNLEVPFIISSNEDTMVSAVIAKMALQIFGWKDMSIQNAYNVAIDSFLLLKFHFFYFTLSCQKTHRLLL